LLDTGCSQHITASTAEGDKAFGAILDVAVEVVGPVLEEGAAWVDACIVVGTMDAVEVVGRLPGIAVTISTATIKQYWINKTVV